MFLLKKETTISCFCPYIYIISLAFDLSLFQVLCTIHEAIYRQKHSLGPHFNNSKSAKILFQFDGSKF